MSDELIKLSPYEPAVTLLPKFTTNLPFFYLTNKRELLAKDIVFESTDSEGRPIQWKVKPNRSEGIGVPSIEAHEVWIKLIKPAIDRGRAKREGEIPSIVPLGSIRQCLRSLGWDIGGWQQGKLIKSIRQIAHAACEADFWLPTGEIDQERKPLFKHIKGFFTRMSIYAIGSKHVTDDDIKSGRVTFDFDVEDTVYLKLDPIEMLIQQSQPLRPTDNQYLFSVSPSERRWLELIQPYFFGVTNNPQRTRGYCDVKYSWYVKHHHTLAKQTERRRIVEQMNKLVRDHKRLGYVSRVEYIEEYDEKDWFGPNKKVSDFIIRYYPGRGAIESNRRIKERLKELQPDSTTKQLPLPFFEKTLIGAGSAPELSQEQQELLAKLLQEGLYIETAESLIREKSEDVKRQLEYLPFRESSLNKAGLLRRAIEQNWTEPEGYGKAKRKKTRTELNNQKAEEEKARREAQELAEEQSYKRAEEKLKALSPSDYETLFEEVRAELIARMPRYKKELSDLASEMWKTTVRASMIRRLQDPE